MLKLPHLFKPIRIGKTLFRNRICSSPQDTYRLMPDVNFLDDDATSFYEYKALGGFASVCVGDFMVDARAGHSHPNQLNGDDQRARVSLTKTADAITRHGAIASVELNHAGSNAGIMAAREGFVYGVSGGVRPDGAEIREMDDEWIERLIAKYASAASFARLCGFNMITIHGGHGWLPAQFISPATNFRRDKWGGSLENRMRFTLAIIDAVRTAVGNALPIEIRISGAEHIDGGYDIDEGIRIAEMLDGRVDLIHVSAGHHENDAAAMVTHPTMFMPDGVNVRYAAAVKQRVKTPVAAVGALTDPAHMEELIASGTVDIVALGRQTLADPFLPKKAREGRDDEINKCLRCFTCFSASTVSGIFYCATNPQTGRERDALYAPPAATKKRVLIVGGGVAGMQAALTASQRGHDVTLCEKSDRLGGVLRCEENVPFKSKIHDYLEKQVRLLSRSAVTVRMNTEVTPEFAAAGNYDAIIAAVGARPYTPPVPGIERAVLAEAVLADASLAKQTVAIMGGGLVGLELGVHLAQLGRTVTIVEQLPSTIATQEEKATSERISDASSLAPGTNVVQGVALAQELKELPNLTVLCSTRAHEVLPDALRCENATGIFDLPAETVICAVGQTANSDLAWSLSACAPEFHAIGDCDTPRNIQAATRAAFQIAMDVGRG